jgi:phosphoribosyl 1,2-cyclic phosphate phosphodiesterase
MRLTFLGTGGSEGYPAAFCTCARCERARQLGGPNLRRRSSIIVDDALLVDLGPDVVAGLQATGRSLANAHTILITHRHDDHFLPITLKYRRRSYVAQDLPMLTLCGSAPSLARLDSVPFTSGEMRLRTRIAQPGRWFELEGYRVLPLEANHNQHQGLEPLVYVIATESASVLYATDTGALPEATWLLLRSVKLDAVVLDATFWGDADADDHLTLDGVVEHVRRMRESGILNARGRALATHFSHRSQPDHATLAARLAEAGVEVAVDGLVVEL